MSSTGIVILGLLILCLAILPFILSGNRNLDKVKAKKTGDGQYGTADFASIREINKNLISVNYDPESWRKGKNLPKSEGIIVGANKTKNKMTAYVDSSDNHTMVVTSPGGGKTTSLLYPNLEYSGACGMSGFITDTKGNVFKEYAPILEKYYGCKTFIIDLRYPLKSASYNFLYLVNKYTDKYKRNGRLSDLALAQVYAKNIADNIIHMNGFNDAGQNQFFYSSAEGVITGVTLLVSEFCKNEERHIVSVFKLIRELMEIDPKTLNRQGVIPKLYLQQIYELLPNNHTAKDFLAPAATSEFKTTASVMSTAMSQMLKFIDKEMEQLLCFDDGFNIDEFVEGKSFIFFVVDEKSNTKNFMVNLIIKQIYGELLKKAESFSDICLPHRVMQWLDEFGTYTKIDGVESMFSAGRSRNILTVPFLQTLAQLDKNYGKDVANTIKNSCQNTLFSYQAPTSDDAEFFSKKLGTKTVTSGSVSIQNNGSRNSTSSTIQMVKMPIMSPDEITRLKKGEWVFMKAGMNPCKMKLYKTEDWGITFDDRKELTERTNREVHYANRQKIMGAIRRRRNIQEDNNEINEKEPPKEKIEENPKEKKKKVLNAFLD